MSRTSSQKLAVAPNRLQGYVGRHVQGSTAGLPQAANWRYCCPSCRPSVMSANLGTKEFLVAAGVGQVLSLPSRKSDRDIDELIGRIHELLGTSASGWRTLCIAA